MNLTIPNRCTGFGAVCHILGVGTVLLALQSEKSNPMDPDFNNYAQEFAKLDLDAVKSDLKKVMADSQDW